MEVGTYALAWRSHTLALAAGLATVLNAPQTPAQTDPLVLEEVMVTARKRVESLQEVPQAISAMTETEIQASFARDIRDLQGMAPNLVIDKVGAGPGVTAISIRGISHQDVEKSFDPAVGVVLDGVFLGTNTGQELQIFDMERIEVLRGPQGTLFGRNSIGGIINVTRTQPTGEWGARIRGTYGDYDRYDVDGVFNFPKVFDMLSTKLTYTTRQQEEGFYDNVFLGEDVPEVDYESYVGVLLLEPTDALSLKYTYQHDEDDSDTAATSNVSQPDDLLCFGFGRCGRSDTEPELGILVTDQNFSNAQSLELDAHTVEANWLLSEGMQLTYLFGYRDTDESTDQDFDSTSIDFFSTSRVQTYDQTSHELRLSDNIGDSIQYTVGGYYWDSKYKLDQTTFYLANILDPNLAPPGTTLLADAEQKTDAWAAFFEVDYFFLEDWTLTLGGRYTEEEKEFKVSNDVDIAGSGFIVPIFSTFGDPGEGDWDEFTPKVSLSWDVNDDMMLYATYAQGFRSGGLNGRAASELTARLTYDPEFVDMYELGMKSNWLNNRVMFNVAAFYQIYDDKQEELVIPSDSAAGQETITVNAAKATMLGLELDSRALITDSWLVGFNLGLLDAEYDNFKAALEPGGEELDLSDLDLRRAPDYTFAVHTNYDMTIGSGVATAQLMYRYRDDQYTTFLNEPMGFSKGNGILDASLAYQWENWNLRVFGRNLTDEDETTAALIVGGLFTFQARQEPRIWGVQVTYDFAAE
ncbi:MAG: TonB-dependent receptor [Pseudomonadota bacterium]